jgi:large subunit ribosomal protein L25
MSSDTIEVELQERKTVTKGLSALREGGHVPAVIHERGKPSVHVMGDYRDMGKVYAKVGKHTPVKLTIGDKKQLAMIKDADFHPVKNRLRHIVFQAIKQNEKVTTEVPIVLVGEDIPAEIAGHLVLPQLDIVQVEAFPKDLPEKLEADSTVLAEVGDKLTVADLKVPAGVTILTEPEHSIAIVEMPKDQLAEANAAAESLAEDAAVKGEEADEEGEKAEETSEGGAASEGDKEQTEKSEESAEK